MCRMKHYLERGGTRRRMLFASWHITSQAPDLQETCDSLGGWNIIAGCALNLTSDLFRWLWRGVQNGCCLAHASAVDDMLQESLWVAIWAYPEHGTSEEHRKNVSSITGAINLLTQLCWNWSKCRRKCRSLRQSGSHGTPHFGPEDILGFCA